MRVLHAAGRKVGILIAACSLGCASVPLAPQATDLAVKRFVAPSRGARVFVAREGGRLTGFHTIFRILVDTKEVAALAPWTYTYVDVSAGRHTIVAYGPENQTRLGIDVDDGKLLFVGTISVPGFAHGHASLRLLSEDAGRELVLGSTLVLPLSDSD